jgi:transcriptional regulator with XRE-family HTH domain
MLHRCVQQGTNRVQEQFRDNLAYAIHARFGAGFKDKALAEALKIDRSTVSRLRRSATLPSRERIEALSAHFGVSPSVWALTREEFVAAFDRAGAAHMRPPAAAGVSVSMRAIEAHRHLWRQCQKIHQGQYIAYWKASGQAGFYVASLLEIGAIGPGGIGFSLINPYIRTDVEHDEIRCWHYEGSLYPVADYLYVFGEQKEGSYELFSMILTASPIAPPDLLRGCLSGIYVRDGARQIAVNIAVVLAYARRPVTDWRRDMGERLGKLPAARVPERIRRLIDPYPGVIAMS